MRNYETGSMALKICDGLGVRYAEAIMILRKHKSLLKELGAKDVPQNEAAEQIIAKEKDARI